MKTAPVPFRSWGFDTDTPCSVTQASILQQKGAAWCCRYLGSITKSELLDLTNAGLGVMGVTFADDWGPDGKEGFDSVARARGVGFPTGVTLWLDVEGLGIDVARVIAKATAWTRAVRAGGYGAGYYFGRGQLLTGREMFELPGFPYWKGCSQLVDRNGQIAEPDCGWSLLQLFPPNQDTIAGVKVDYSAAQYDYRGRAPVMAVRD